MSTGFYDAQEDVLMNWSVYSDISSDDPKDWVEDFSTVAPDGVYTVEFNYLGDASGSEYGVEVKDNQFVDPKKVCELVGKAREQAGYWGTFLEEMEFVGDRFEAHIGS